ncbi:hypothetical protein BGZ70_006472, partial [Mortierella alpina]
TIKEYGSFDEVKSIKKYLEFLTKTPGAMEGSKTDHTLYFLKKYGGKAGAQAADRSQGKPSSDYSDRAHATVQGKRSAAGSDSRNRGYKKPKFGVQRELCTYSPRCIAKKLRNEKEDCFKWRDDQAKKKSRDERSNSQSSQSRDGPKYQSSR